MKIFLQILYAVVAITVMGAILYPVFARPSHSPRLRLTLNLKQLGTGFLIYAADYEDRLPHATSRPAVISQLSPYVRNDRLWDAVKDTSLTTNFNFNVAGVRSVDKPIGFPQADPTEITLVYALTDPKYKVQGAFQTRLDSSAKFIRLPELLDTLALQFDRSGVTLAPPDYIAPTSEELDELFKDQVK